MKSKYEENPPLLLRPEIRYIVDLVSLRLAIDKLRRAAAA